MNSLKCFLIKFLTNQDNIADKECSLIKRSEKACEKWDLCFPTNIQMWRKYLENEIGVSESGPVQKNILNYKRNHLTIDEILKDLVQLSGSWEVSIRSADFLNDKCVLYLDRQKLFRNLIPVILEDPEDYGKESEEGDVQSVYMKLDEISETPTVTEYRTQLVLNVLKNLLIYSRYSSMDNPEKADYHFLISSKSNKKKEDITSEPSKLILCGSVTDPKNGNKLAEITAEEYTKKRANDVNLMAQHKYGLRVKNEKIFVDLIERLGRYAVTVDFLEVKVSSPVGLNTSSTGGMGKGASFILYNSARLETLIDNFEQRVRDGYYPALPEFESIDIDLLKEEVFGDFRIPSIFYIFLNIFFRKNGSFCSTTSSHFLTLSNVAFAIYWMEKFTFITFVHIYLDWLEFFRCTTGEFDC
jgi:hypothetical protein